MPRKSRAVRLAQTVELVEAYKAAHLSQNRNCRFAEDMAARLQRGKGLSARQRTWLDDIIETGIPAPKNTALVTELETAAAVVGMEGKAHILQDFAGRARMGWDFSDKQKSFVDSLLAQAEEMKKNGPYAPDAAEVEKLELCVLLAESRNVTYWNTHPGEAKALMKVRSWLVWKASNDADLARPGLDEWCVDKILKTFRSKLVQLENPKFAAGDMYWLYERSPRANGYVPAVVMSGPQVDERGRIVYDALVQGRVISTGSITKVRRK